MLFRLISLSSLGITCDAVRMTASRDMLSETEQVQAQASSWWSLDPSQEGKGHPALCDAELVKQGCLSMDLSSSGETVVSVEEIMETISANHKSAQEFLAALGVEVPSDDRKETISCSELCDKVKSTIGPQWLPPVSDVACRADSQVGVVCDIDLSPATLEEVKFDEQPPDFHAGHPIKDNSTFTLNDAKKASLAVTSVDDILTDVSVKDALLRMANIFRMYPFVYVTVAPEVEEEGEEAAGSDKVDALIEATGEVAEAHGADYTPVVAPRLCAPKCRELGGRVCDKEFLAICAGCPPCEDEPLEVCMESFCNSNGRWAGCVSKDRDTRIYCSQCNTCGAYRHAGGTLLQEQGETNAVRLTSAVDAKENTSGYCFPGKCYGSAADFCLLTDYCSGCEECVVGGYGQRPGHAPLPGRLPPSMGTCATGVCYGNPAVFCRQTMYCDGCRECQAGGAAPQPSHYFVPTPSSAFNPYRPHTHFGAGDLLDDDDDDYSPLPAPRPSHYPSPHPAPRPYPTYVPEPAPVPRPRPVPRPWPLPRPVPTWRDEVAEISIKAQAYVAEAIRRAPRDSQVLMTWMGEDNRVVRAELMRVLNSLSGMLANVEYQKGDQCSSNTYAYVYPSAGHLTKNARGQFIFYLCDYYFKSPEGEKIETLTHEGSHHATSFTNDVCSESYDSRGECITAYGRPLCKKVARKYPELAQKNADSYCYYINDINGHSH